MAIGNADLIDHTVRSSAANLSISVRNGTPRFGRDMRMRAESVLVGGSVATGRGLRCCSVERVSAVHPQAAYTGATLTRLLDVAPRIA